MCAQAPSARLPRDHEIPPAAAPCLSSVRARDCPIRRAVVATPRRSARAAGERPSGQDADRTIRTQGAANGFVAPGGGIAEVRPAGALVAGAAGWRSGRQLVEGGIDFVQLP